MKTNTKHSISDIVVFGVLTIQILILFIFNITKTAAVTDYDSSAAMAQAMEIVKQKTFFIKHWDYQSTLGLDSMLPVAAFIYAVTGNIFISYGISNCLGTLLYIFIIIITAKQLGMSCRMSYIMGIFILTPLSSGMLGYFPMMFISASYYMMKSLLPVLLILITLKIKNSCFKKCDIFLLILLAWLSFFTGFSCTIYLLLCGFVPVLLTLLVNIITIRRTNSSIKHLLISGIPSISACILCICGTVTAKIYYPYSFSSGMVLCRVDNFFDNLQRFIIGFFELFGAISYSDTKVLSVNGIFVLLHLSIAVLYIFTFILGVKRIIHNYKNNDYLYFLMVFVINCIILMLTYTTYGSSTYEYRYWIIPVISGLFVCCYGIRTYAHNLLEKEIKLLYIILSVYILAVSLFSYTQYFSGCKKQSDIESVMNMLENNNIDIAYFIDKDTANETDARILRLYSENVDIVYGTEYGKFKGWGTSDEFFDINLIENSCHAIITTQNDLTLNDNKNWNRYEIGRYIIYLPT